MSPVDIVRLSLMDQATKMVAAQIAAMGVVAPIPYDPKNAQTQDLVTKMFVSWKIWYDGLQKSFDHRVATDNLADPTPTPESGANNLSLAPNLQSLIGAVPGLAGISSNLPLLNQLLSTLQNALTPPSSAPAMLSPTAK